eukprot:TRINITY_DN22007_c0_g1_i2.p1 TRINITY_DN22007_c0_g1~~TRINITY_DN22007_c0_g1_i2.p1  ORF type:complete len:150 (+),score=21.14 TRINITY_DN22007_c0_g1_i2:158-607(+)
MDYKTRIITFDGDNVKLMMWDASGQERFLPVVVSYFAERNAVFFVFDITNRDSFLGIEAWYNICMEKNKRAVKFLIGNKTDLEASRVVTFEEASAYAASHDMTYFEVSAQTGNLEPNFITSAQTIRSEMNKQGVRLRKEDKIPLYTSCF